MNHRQCRDLFVEALYGELAKDLGSEFDAHLKSCPECNAAFQELRGLASVLNRRKRIEPTQPEWTSFWNELEPKLRISAPPVNSRPVSRRFVELLGLRPAWVLGVAAAALVALGIVIGQLMVTPPLDTDNLGRGITEAERILLNERALNYLERSRVLLLGIVNSGATEPTTGTLMKEQLLSRELVTEAAALKSELTEADEQRMKQLVAELEILLLHIANLERQKDFPALEIVQSGVERTGILLKINLEQMRSQQEASGRADKSATKPQATSS